HLSRVLLRGVAARLPDPELREVLPRPGPRLSLLLAPAHAEAAPVEVQEALVAQEPDPSTAHPAPPARLPRRAADLRAPRPDHLERLRRERAGDDLLLAHRRPVRRRRRRRLAARRPARAGLGRRDRLARGRHDPPRVHRALPLRGLPPAPPPPGPQRLRPPPPPPP